MDVAREYIKNIDKIAPCPEVALDVLSIAHESDCSIPKLAEKIEQDPGLTANMLQMANSAYFGHIKKITSIRDIIVRLGLETVKIIAITSASVGLLNTPQKGYALGRGELWHHSYGVATLANIIGRYAKVRDNAAIYTAALLHDVGKIILDRPLQLESYNRDNQNPPLTMIERERNLLHTDHAEVGMALLEKWGLPESICVPVGLHHDMSQPRAKRLGVKIVHLADFLAHITEYDPEKPEDMFFDALAYEDHKENLPEVPHFEKNMRLIIDEYIDKFTETVSVFEL
ncbi:MAG: HDOD domain-containing protein [Desulfobulbaceae bacterium]|nr:HDOD domain-containing protein [Desulfobulbaceae bacterium]HIJ78353.1 HDOD domain-containing protein [Deltaproteobacteria bacterium]